MFFFIFYYIIYDIIYDILLACVSLPLQRPIFPLHRALTTMILTEQWIQTTRVTMQINSLCQTGTWKKTIRFLQHFCNRFLLVKQSLTLNS